ncbi:MAG TPA: cytochrome c [Terracidiphilus sp.]|nr:cytochrome c [Terracidiphilus sp.]
MLKPILLVSAVALIAFSSSTVRAAAQDAASKTKITADSQSKAKKLYAMDCALCHGATGDGKTDLAKDMQLTLMDWTDPKTLADHSDQELFKVIREGKGKMPAEEANRAKDDEVWNLIVLIRSFGKAGAPAAAPATAAPATTPAPSSSAPGSN